jgi:hypothetical protein
VVPSLTGGDSVAAVSAAEVIPEWSVEYAQNVRNRGLCSQRCREQPFVKRVNRGAPGKFQQTNAV